MNESSVAVLIDFENVRGDALNDLFDKLADVGRIIVRRAYADWSAEGKQSAEQLSALGIEAIQNFRASVSGKNSSDISLAIDAVELLHASPIDVFVIVSADSDFVPLVRKLRAQGKHVVGAGRQDVVSTDLVRSCDRYIYLGTVARTGRPREQTSSKPDDLVLRALRASTDSEGKVVAAKLHNTMLRIDPTFDYKSLGFRTFTKFLESCGGIKISRPTGRGDWVIEEA